VLTPKQGLHSLGQSTWPAASVWPHSLLVWPHSLPSWAHAAVFSATTARGEALTWKPVMRVLGPLLGAEPLLWQVGAGAGVAGVRGTAGLLLAESRSPVVRKEGATYLRGASSR
jgi:hypothetical protein